MALIAIVALLGEVLVWARVIIACPMEVVGANRLIDISLRSSRSIGLKGTD